MRTVLLALGVALALAPAAAAQAPGEGFARNAELVENHAIGPSSGARLVDGHFYITTGRDLRIFDARTDPEHPAEVGSVAFPEPDGPSQRAPEEDPDTNGRILLTTYSGALQVFDVSDKTAPRLLSTLEGVSQHTISCVLDCTWAYGSEGAIVDLRDPAAPKLAGDWYELHTTDSTHDVTEVAPGLVLTATEPMMLLDARSDPAHPVRLAEGRSPGFLHATAWPNAMTDDMLLAGGEAMGPDCSADGSATFQTWDTRGWEASRAFTLIDEFAMSTGLPATTGSMPATTFCVHWFGTHPAYRDGGLVGIGWYEHGTRFLAVGLDGSIEEVGYFLPLGTRSSGVYWASDRIAYVADYYRGFDVVRFTGEIPPSAAADGPAPPPGPPAAGGPSFSDLVRLPSARRCVRRLKIRVRRHGDPVVRAELRVNGRRARVARGRALRRPIVLRRIPRGRRLTLSVHVRTRSGHQTAGQRTYRSCSG